MKLFLSIGTYKDLLKKCKTDDHSATQHRKSRSQTHRCQLPRDLSKLVPGLEIYDSLMHCAVIHGAIREWNTSVSRMQLLVGIDLCVCVCIYACIEACMIYLFIYLFIYPSACFTIYLSINLSISPSINISINPTIHLSTYLSISLSINISIDPSTHLPIYLLVYQYIY